MIEITRIEYEKLSVNGKIITVEAGKVVNNYDLSDEEQKAVKNYLRAFDKFLKENEVIRVHDEILHVNGEDVHVKSGIIINTGDISVSTYIAANEFMHREIRKLTVANLNSKS